MLKISLDHRISRDISMSRLLVMTCQFSNSFAQVSAAIFITHVYSLHISLANLTFPLSFPVIDARCMKNEVKKTMLTIRSLIVHSDKFNTITGKTLDAQALNLFETFCLAPLFKWN